MNMFLMQIKSNWIHVVSRVTKASCGLRRVSPADCEPGDPIGGQVGEH